jgi:hypothetical protein
MILKLEDWDGWVISQEQKMKGSQKEDSEWEIPQHKISRETKNKMGECHPGGCITGARNMRMKEMSWG